MGVKPTYGLVPVGGVQALAPSLDTVGVLARDVATASAVLSVIGQVEPLPLPPPGTVTLGLLRDQLDDPRLTPGVRAALDAAVDRLRAAGIRLVERDGSAMADLADTFEPVVLFEAWQELGPLAGAGELGADTDRLLRAGRAVDRATYAKALTRRQERLPAALAVADGVDALLGPVVASAAPGATPVLDSPEGEVEAAFTCLANLTGQPALSLPCGTDGTLPVGLQLTGHRGQDAALLAVAAVVEDALGGTS